MTQPDINKGAKDYRELQGMMRELENEAEAIKRALTRHMEAQQVDSLMTVATFLTFLKVLKSWTHWRESASGGHNLSRYCRASLEGCFSLRRRHMAAPAPWSLRQKERGAIRHKWAEPRRA